MLAPVLRRALIASGVIAATLAAGVLAADAATTGWRIEATVPAPAGDIGILFAVHADGRGDAWGVGGYAATLTSLGSPLVDRWNGHAWAQVTLPSTVTTKFGRGSVLLAVGSSSAANVWAFGICGSRPSSCWLRRSGTAWTTGKLSVRRFGTVIIDHVLVLGKRNVWAFGSKQGTHRLLAFSMHYDGSGWRPERAPGAATVVDASAVSSSDIWAAEGTPLFSVAAKKGPLIHWSGGQWHALAVPRSLRGNPLESIVAMSDKSVWIGGATRNGKGGTTEAVGHWNGRRWTVTTMRIAASSAKYTTFALASDGHGGLWAAGDNLRGGATRLWHFSGGRWVRATVASSRPVTLIGLASVPGTRSLWGIGIAGRGSTRSGVIALDGAVPH
jgi:hypothetical protein